MMVPKYCRLYYKDIGYHTGNVIQTRDILNVLQKYRQYDKISITQN